MASEGQLTVHALHAGYLTPPEAFFCDTTRGSYVANNSAIIIIFGSQSSHEAQNNSDYLKAFR